MKKSRKQLRWRKVFKYLALSRKVGCPHTRTHTHTHTLSLSLSLSLSHALTTHTNMLTHNVCTYLVCMSGMYKYVGIKTYACDYYGQFYRTTDIKYLHTGIKEVSEAILLVATEYTQVYNIYKSLPFNHTTCTLICCIGTRRICGEAVTSVREKRSVQEIV